MPLPRARLAPRLALLLLLALAGWLISTAVPQRAAAYPVIEPFTNSGVASPNWKFTSAANTTAGNTVNSAALTAPTDGEGNGWLRLTGNVSDQRGWAFYDEAFSSNQGIVLEFDYAMYGGTGADGISAFLYSGATTDAQFRIGAVGGSLGYCPRAGSPNYQSLRNPWVAIGLDRFGNFATNSHCTGGSGAGQPNSIVVRGPNMGSAPLAVVPVPEGLEATRANARKVRIVITTDYRLTVSMRFPNGTTTTYVNNLQLPTPPSTLKFGYAAATGGQTNIQEIRGGSGAVLSDLGLSTLTDGVTSASRGAARTWTSTVTNSGPNAAPGATITATTGAQSLTGVTWTCTAAGGAACGTASGSGLPTNQTTGAIPNGGSLTYAITGTPAAGTDWAELQLTASTAGDPDLANNSSTDTTWLTPEFDTAPGVTVAGNTITAVPTAARGGNLTTTHAWLRCDESGANCTVIGGQTTASYTLTAADRGHTIRYRQTATNAAGSANAASSTVALPSTTITSAPSGATGSTAATITFSSLAIGATFECQLDGGAWTACSSPLSLTGLSQGAHTFAVRAVVSGLSDPTPPTASWTVDTAAPDTTISTSVPAQTAQTSIELSFTGSDTGGTGVAAYQCRIDAGTWTTCSSPHTFAGLADGSRTLAVRAIDAAGNIDATPATRTTIVDTTAPTSTFTATPVAATSATTATFNFTAADAGSGVSRIECRLDGAAWATCTSPQALSGLSQGSHTFQIRAVDNAGNVQSPVTSHTWVVDTTAPETGAVSGVPSITNLTTASLTFSGSDTGGTGVASYQCRLDGGAWAACSSPRALTGVAQGSHTFEVRAIDAAGNTDATPSAISWTVDTTAPATGAITGVPSITNQTTASLTFSGADTGGGTVASYECRLDGGAWAACTSPRALTGLAQGSHTFEVRAIDTAGNTDASPSTLTWTVDTTAPATGAITGVPSITNQATASLSFSATDTGGGTVASYECRLDGGAWAACTSPRALTGLAQGSHTFEVRAIDTAGNTDASPSTRTWTVDTTAPATDAITGVPSITNQTTASLSFSGTDTGGGTVASYECRLDGGAWAACTSPRALTGLAQGSHTFEARAIDSAGNTDASPSTLTWTVDTTAPATGPITGVPSATSDATASLSFSATDSGGGTVASYECRLDGGAWAACTSPRELSGLAQGSHTFEVRAIDTAGNTDASPSTLTWTVDTTAPTTSISTSLPPFTGASDVTLDFSGSDAGGSGVASYECRVDGGSWTPCTSPRTFTGLADGPHTFEVRAIDTAGNADASPATATTTVDTTAPTVTLTDTPPTVTASGEASFSFTASDGAGSGVDRVQCRLDGGSWGDCTSPHELTGFADGTHTLELRAIDDAGNVQASPASHTWTVDSGAPQTGAVTGVPAATSATLATLSFTGSDAGGSGISSFECRLDGGAWAPCTSPAGFGGLLDGEHTVQVRAIDQAGNVDPTPSEISWTVDTVDPQTGAIGGVAPVTFSPSASLSWSGSSDAGGSGIASYECRLDGSAWAPCSSPENLSGLADGDHTFEVRAIDQAGNVDPSPSTITWTVDRTVPETTLTSTHPAATADADVTLEFTGSDSSGVAFFECRADAGPWEICFSPHTFTGLSDGSHTLRVRAVDGAGNSDTTPEIVTILVDTQAPATTISAGPDAATSQTTADFTLAADDGSGSGVATVECRLDGDAWAPCASPLTLTGLADGEHLLQVRATDDVGNVESPAASYAWTVDTAAPETGAVSGVPVLTGDTDATVTWDGSDAGTGVASYECRLDGGSWTPCATPLTLTGLADGSHTLEVRAIDAAGNTDATPSAISWTVDTAVPTTSPITGVDAATSETSATLSFTGTGVSFECRIDGGSWEPCVSPLELTGLSDGPHTVQARSISGSGVPDTSPSSITWTVDTAAPTTTVSTSLPASSSDPDVEVEFSGGDAGGSGVSSFECRVNADAWAPCTSPHTFTGLPDGEHTLQVRAIDGAGNADATPWSQTIVIDTTAPETTLTSTPDAISGSADASFAFTTDDGAGTGVDEVQCRLDGGSWNACTSPLELTGLADGDHELELRATDQAGNVETPAVSYSWTIDTAAPSLGAITGVLPISSSADASLEFSATDSGSGLDGFECRVDGGSWSPCTSPLELSGLADGTHSVSVRAIDQAGNESAPSTIVWLIDTTDPETGAITGVGPVSSSSAPTLTFTGSDAGGSGVSGFGCRLDGGSWAPCASPLALSGLADGSHTLQVRAIDAAGHTDQSPSTLTWIVDTVAPTTDVTTTPPAQSNDPDVTVEFGGNDPAGPGGVTFECRVNGGSWTACTSPHTFDDLPDGTHTIEVRAVDEAGNPDGTPWSHTVVVDTTAPATTVTAGPGAISGSASQAITFTSTDGSGTGVDRVECRLDGGSWSVCTSPLQLSGLADGDHTFELRATDELGNVQSPLTRVEWTVDTTAPSTTITSAPPASTQATTAEIAFTGGDGSGTGIDRYECSVDGAAWAPCSGQLTLTGLAAGDHEVRIRAIDRAGNVEGAPAVARWTVTAPPSPNPDPEPTPDPAPNPTPDPAPNPTPDPAPAEPGPAPSTPLADPIGIVPGLPSIAAASFAPQAGNTDMTFAVSNQNGIKRVVVTLSRGAIFRKGIAKKLKPTVEGGKAKLKLVNGDRRIAITVTPLDPAKPVTKIRFKVPRSSIKINIKVRRVLQNKKISAKKRKATLQKILKPSVAVTDTTGATTPIRIITRIK